MASISLLFAAVSIVSADEALFSSVTELTAPVADGARERSLSTMGNGRVLMSWAEPHGNGFAVKIAIADGVGWYEPRTVVQGDDLFVN